MNSQQILQKYFGFNNFRLGQKEIIDSILNNKNVLAVMPTGAGKSICYQIPALMNENFSIVISPLISLMQDQVDSINKNEILAAFINSSLDYSQTEKVLQNIANKKIKLLYIAPEKLGNLEFVEKIKNLKPFYVFIDEAHCISEWGHNFRPSYRNIKNFTDLIKVKNISAFTATATPEVRKDIIDQLKFENPAIHISGFERENISLSVSFDKNKKEKIYELLKGNDKSTIIYTSTRKNAEQLTKYLKIKNTKVEFYHAGLSNELRKIIQDDFISDRLKIIVATNAFGMGIDKSDTNFVIHYNVPGSIENLYQEFGRAGRDGSEAKAILFYSEQDKQIQEFLIKLNYPTYDQIKQCYASILDYNRIAVNNISQNLLEIDAELLKLIESKSIPKNLISSILSALETNGYLKLHSSNSLSHFIQFLLKPDDLKKYLKGMYNSELQEFVIQLIKHFGKSIFESKVKLDFEFFENSFSQTRKNIEEFLFILNNVGIIKYDKPTFAQKIQMLQERVETKNLRLDKEEITNKIILAEKKLNKIVEYANTNNCRFKYILDYFGELTENYSCGKCDNCTGSKSSSINKEYINEIIIRTFKEYNSALSEQRLIGIIKGTSKSIVAKKISTYQNCKNYSINDIEHSINTLLSKNILKNINGDLVFNPMEELFSVEDDEFENNVVEKNNYENSLELFNKLKSERDLAAKKFSQNQQIICTDKILRELTKIKPKTPSQIMQIDGFNQRMYNKVGQEFLSIIQEHNETNDHISDSNQLPKHISQTYELVCKKYSLADISNLLKLPESIASIQIETIINFYPKLDYSALIQKSEFELIKNAIEDFSEELKTIKQKLSANISYSKIRITKAILQAQVNS